MAEPIPGYYQTDGGLYAPTDLRASDNALSDLRHPTAWLTDWALQGGRNSAGVHVSPQASMGLPTYYACIRAISEDVGKLPLQVFERTEDGRNSRPDHWLSALLHDQFSDDMTAMTGRETITAHALGWGNGLGYLLRDRSLTRREGEVVGIYPVHPSRVRTFRDTRGRLWYQVAPPSGMVRDSVQIPDVVPAEDMLHIHGPSQDGCWGYSVCQVAAESLGLSLAAQQYGAAFFGNAATPSGVLSHPGKLSDPARKNLRESLENRHVGPSNTGKVMLLEEGMRWESITIPPEQAQLLMTRTFQGHEVARWFRMPPHKVGFLENAHYNNVEQLGIEYVVDTLGAWLVRWEQEIRLKLLLEEPSLYVKHNVNALLRGDMAARSAFYREMIHAGVYSPNVVLELEDMNGYEGGEEHFMQLSMAPVRKIIDGTARQQPASVRRASAIEPDDMPASPEDTEEARASQNGHRHGYYTEVGYDL